MRRILPTIFVVLLARSLSIAAPPSPAPSGPAKTGQGIRYQLADALEPGAKRHTIFFVLSDAAGKTVVSEKFTGRVPKGLTNPTFALLRDEDARAAAMARASSMIVTVDGQLFDRVSLNELLSRASHLMKMDSSRSPFVSVRPRAFAIHSPEVATQSASQKLHPQQEDTWPGCGDEDYCYAQYYYCNDNCSPWDPYNPCEACDSNLSDCQGGVELSAWSEDTLISRNAVLDVCGALDQGYALSKTYEQDQDYIHHQEFQYWLCSEEDGDHYTTFTTVDTYYYQYCYHLIDGASCNVTMRAEITCTF